MKTPVIVIKRTLFTLLLIIIYCAAFAQKLPNKQQVSVRAPTTLKIDGKATEWNNRFQAYNNSTDVFYTLSNDDDNIYLIVQATKPRIIEKIIGVGVSFIIKNDDRAKENISLTFPLIEVKSGMNIINKAGIKSSNVNVLKGPDTTKISQVTDSLIALANKALANNAKAIKVKGVKALDDTLLSVYNEAGVRVAALFDNAGKYTYELALPLKLVGLAARQKFGYSIKLASRLDEKKKGVLITYRYVNNQAVDVNQDLDSTTDFWAEYTLAKQ